MAADETPSTPADGLTDDDVAQGWVEYYQDNPSDFFENGSDAFGLGMTLADTQKRVMQAVEDGHRQIIVVSGNKTGKTATATMLGEWHYQTFYNSFTMITSGNYDILKDSSWRFLKTVHQQAVDAGWHGVDKESPPRIEHPEYDEWFLRYMSPRDPQNLEGRHGRKNLVVIEEADKPDVTSQHFESAGSSVVDVDDIVIALANPPQTKQNVVYDLMNSPNWHTIQFSSFESHNVKRELGELDGDPGRIPGLATLDLIKQRWDEWNRREWPGVEDARTSHPQFHGPDSDKWENLDPRWYRRMLGKMPPGGASTLRPFYERDVDAAVDRWTKALDDPDQSEYVRMGLGFDVARGGGDRSIIVEYRVDGVLDVAAGPVTNIDDHQRNYDLADEAYERGPLQGWFHVDAIGEGSGVGDYVSRTYPAGTRFMATREPEDDSSGASYYDWRTWALVQLGNALKDHAVIPPGSEIEKELRQASRVLELEERHLRGGDVLMAKGKDELKKSKNLGRSPDYLDASALATFSHKPRRDFKDVDVGGAVI